MQMRRKNPSGFIASICRLAPSRSPGQRPSGVLEVRPGLPAGAAADALAIFQHASKFR
ncbi:hypothetical protein GGP63_003305 [Salinibacter ruber]|jgi:hypothetical protein|nr:hypothetical protein [Salinibacter ruber]